MRLESSISSSGRQQPVAADLVEEELQRVGGRPGERDVVERRGLGVAAAVVAQVDPARLELLVEPADVVVVELERLGQLVDLGQVEAARRLAPVDERGHRSLVAPLITRIYLVRHRHESSLNQCRRGVCPI